MATQLCSQESLGVQTVSEVGSLLHRLQGLLTEGLDCVGRHVLYSRRNMSGEGRQAMGKGKQKEYKWARGRGNEKGEGREGEGNR